MRIHDDSNETYNTISDIAIQTEVSCARIHPYTLRTSEEITDSVAVIVVISRTESCLPENKTALLVLSDLSLELRKEEEGQF